MTTAGTAAAAIMLQQAAEIADLRAQLAAAEARIAAFEAEPLVGFVAMTGGCPDLTWMIDDEGDEATCRADAKQFARTMGKGYRVVALHARELREEVTGG